MLRKEFDRFLQNLVPAGADAFNRRMHQDVRLQSNPLQLAAIRPSRFLPCEAKPQPARYPEGSPIPVGSRSGAANKCRAVGGLEKQTGVFRLAHGTLIDQHHCLATAFRFGGLLQTLFMGRGMHGSGAVTKIGDAYDVPENRDATGELVWLSLGGMPHAVASG